MLIDILYSRFGTDIIDLYYLLVKQLYKIFV